MIIPPIRPRAVVGSLGLPGMVGLSALLLFTCESSSRSLTEVQGSAMGTSYSVKVVTGSTLSSAEEERLSALISGELESVDRAMSTYRSDSELSRFNRTPAGEAFTFSAETFEVLDAAIRLSEESGGTFDVTVGPLVNAWGFGPGDRSNEIPSDERIRELLARVGFRKLELNESTASATKSVAELTVDLSAVAKGFAVDEVADALEHAGFSEYLVEIGGELRALGRNAQGDLWRVAIERPDPQARRPLRILSLGEADASSLATSGDYRNFFEVDGVSYSHTLDPRTGRPVRHRATSVSVLHQSALLADGLATTLMVLGPEDGLRFADERNLPALFVVYNQQGNLEQLPSSAMKERLDAAAGPPSP